MDAAFADDIACEVSLQSVRPVIEFQPAVLATAAVQWRDPSSLPRLVAFEHGPARLRMVHHTLETGAASDHVVVQK